MKIKVIFDIWLIGDSADALKTGIYRVADLLFRNLYSQKEIKLFYANDGYITGKCANENIAVYLHEKEINIESNINCGTIYKIKLPVNREVIKDEE